MCSLKIVPRRTTSCIVHCQALCYLASRPLNCQLYYASGKKTTVYCLLQLSPAFSRGFFFLNRFIAQKIQRDTQGYKIVPLTNLPQLSFAEASDRVCAVLGMYKCSSGKQVQREKHCGVKTLRGEKHCGRFLFYYTQSTEVSLNVKMCRSCCTYTHTGVLFRRNVTPHKSGLKLIASSFVSHTIIAVLCQNSGLVPFQ